MCPPSAVAEPQRRFGSCGILIFKQSEQAAGGCLIMTEAKVSAGRWSAPLNMYIFFKLVITTDSCAVVFKRDQPL